MKNIYIIIALLCAVSISNILQALPTVTTWTIPTNIYEFDLSTTDAADIVIIEAGSRNHIYFYKSPGLEGSYDPIDYPVTIKNEDCATKVLINNEGIKDYLIKFYYVKNVRFTGTGSSSFDYGIELQKQAACTLAIQHGIVIGPHCSNIKIDHIYIHDLPGDGIKTSWPYDAGDQSSWYSNDVNAEPGTNAKMEHIRVHHNKIENVAGNGVILGNKDVYDAHPYTNPSVGISVDYYSSMQFEDTIDHNIVSDIGLDGIALYGDVGKGCIFHNYIGNYGDSIPIVDYCTFAAIVVGFRCTNSLVFNNVIRYGKGHGIYDCGAGNTQYFNNIITEAGFSNSNPNYFISGIHIDHDPNLVSYSNYHFVLYNNTIVKPYSYGVNLLANTSMANNYFYYNIIALSDPGSQGYFHDNGFFLTFAVGVATNKQYATINGPKFLNPLTDNKLKPTSSAINACNDSYLNSITSLAHDYRHCNHGYNLSFTCPTCNPTYENYRPKCGVNDAGAAESPYCSMLHVAYKNPGLSPISVDFAHNIPLKIYGERAEEDDYIAICSERNDSITCGGFIMWEDTNRVCLVYPRDSAGNGFLTNEKLLYFFYDASRMEYIELKAKYDTSYSNQGVFIPGDSCKLTGLYQVQEIPLRQGWSILSTFIVPDSANIEDVMADIEANVTQVQDYDTAYVPGQYNGIGEIEISKAYKVQMSAADTLVIWGTAVRPENTPVPLDGVDPDWCLFSYLRTSNAPIANLFENYTEDIDHVKIIKNQDGIIYWPEYGINFIDTMIPGQGYEAKMNTEDTITYPTNDSLIVFKASSIKIEPTHFITNSRTNNSLALGIDNTAWDIEPVWGDEIAVFNKKGKLVGSGVYQGKNMALTVWGVDGTENSPNGLADSEEMTFMLFSPSTEKEERFTISSWIEGSGIYKANGISIAGSVKRTSSIVETRLLQNYPNPFKEFTTIRFYLSRPCNATIAITNQEGKMIQEYELGLSKQGNNVFNISSRALPGGVYYYTLNAGEFSGSGKMIVVK